MMYRIFVALVLAAVATAYTFRGQSQMNLGKKISKAVGIAALGISLTAGSMPQSAFADGAVSSSTVYRARNNYGAKIYKLKDAVEKADFSAFESKSVSNNFDLFISGSNALNSQIDKDRKAAEKQILNNIYAAVNAKDASKLRAAYNDFIKVADLQPEYKPNELGQTDSSGYSPTWGTERQFIYQR